MQKPIETYIMQKPLTNKQARIAIAIMMAMNAEAAAKK